MAAERLSMRKLRELFRLRFEAKLTTRSIATSLGIGNGTVCDDLGRARVAKLTWPLPPELDDDAALTALLFPEDAKALAERPESDWARVHAELKKKGVTKLLLWQEYMEAVPDGYQYSRFCERYGRWLAASSVTLRQNPYRPSGARPAAVCPGKKCLRNGWCRFLVPGHTLVRGQVTSI
jgi:transposase